MAQELKLPVDSPAPSQGGSAAGASMIDPLAGFASIPMHTSVSGSQAGGPPPLPGGRASAPMPMASLAAAVDAPTIGAAGAADELSVAGAAGADAEEDADAAAQTDAQGDESQGGQGRRVARRRPAGPVRGRVAANDDAPSIGGLIYALEQKPSDKPFRYATMTSLGWAVFGGAFAFVTLRSELAGGATLGDLLLRPTTFALLAAIVVPIGLVYLLALLAWRAEELRLRSSTMTEVAIRLAEPDRMAEQSIASLGQSVRRQVSFMNDAVSRALGRAGELEALVHSEVAALERSYEENERRIRGLIQELSGERHALLNTSDQVAGSLKSLGSEVPALIEKLATQQTKLAHIIQGAGENLTSLESAISQTTLQLETSVARSSERLEGAMTAGGTRIETSLAHGGALIETVLAQGGTRIETSLTQGSALLETSLVQHGTRIEAALAQGGARLEAAYAHGNEHLDAALADGVGRMEGMLEGYTAALGAALGSRNDHMQEMLEAQTASLADALSRRTDNLQTVFEEYTRALDTSISHRADALDVRLVERTKALDAAFSARLSEFDEAIMRSTLAIDAAVGDKQQALVAALEAHAKNFGDTVQKQALQLDDSLMHGINAVRRSSENITRQSLKAIEGLANQSDLLKSVSENLLGQINTVTNRFENQGTQIMRAANALESVNYKIDQTLQHRHAALNDTLDRLSGKADEFGRFVEGYSTSLEGSLTEAEIRARAVAEEMKVGAETRQRAALADLQRLKSETDAEGERALDDLRRRLSSVSSEVSQQLGSLTSRFDETSEEVRQRAARAAAELAEEQSRLRREMERLPAATRDSADAMRRALGDQIKALEQLSSFTTRAAVERDVAAPIPQPRALPAPGPAAAAAAAEAAPRMASLTSTLAQELGRQQVAGGGPAVAPSAPPAPALPVSSLADAQREHWSLGDLLKRASFDDDPAPASAHAAAAPVAPPAAAPSGQPFVLNIEAMSRALDPATASAIWARLRTGQRGVMVRSIYTAEGRATFDEVSRRYKNDGELKGTIDRYLADFERILKDAEARDGSGRLAQSHLVSETGRVYLFLNHASGRLA